MKLIAKYEADKGSAVINGVSFSNGYGDGAFTVWFCEKQPQDVDEVAFIDLRDGVQVMLWEYDCDPASARDITKDLEARAVSLGFNDSGDLFFWKMF